MCDENEKYYQQHATKEDIENLDDKLEHMSMDMKVMQVQLDNLSHSNKKLIACTQRAGRMAKDFLRHVPNIKTEKLDGRRVEKGLHKAILFLCKY